MDEQLVDYGDGLFRRIDSRRLADDVTRKIVGWGCRDCLFYRAGLVEWGIYGDVALHSLQAHGRVLVASYTRPIVDGRGWLTRWLFGPVSATIQCDKCYAILSGQLHFCSEQD